MRENYVLAPKRSDRRRDPAREEELVSLGLDPVRVAETIFPQKSIFIRRNI